MSESQQLLAEYVRSGSETAFRELVRRYINLVYSTALRLMQGDAHAAHDVTQTVFIHLWRKAGQLPPDVLLGGWLHRDACFTAGKLVRHEHRRQLREQEAALMQGLPDHSRANLEKVAPILDETINALEEQERQAILLRFFEQRDFRSVGLALGSSEDAARMRVTRALDKLHSLLQRRGVTLSATALAAGLTGEAVTAAPAGLAAQVAGAAMAASTGAASLSTLKLVSMTKMKLALAGLMIVSGAAIPLAIQHRAQVQLQEENRLLRQRVQALAGTNQSLSNQLAQAQRKATLEPEPERELLKLRGEVGILRRQLAQASRVQPKPANPAPELTTETTPEREYLRQVGIAKMNYAKVWVTAFRLFAERNQGQFPIRFEQALPFWPTDHQVSIGGQELSLQPDGSVNGTAIYGLVPERFEIVYQGTVEAIQNPATIIVLREKEAWQTPNGGWSRTYGFADGHSEIHHSDDGNFQPWEQLHLLSATAEPDK